MKINTKSLPWVGISHDPSIMKKIFLKNGDVPQVTTFGKAVFKPGQSVKTHKHPTMYEVFYILSGKAIFTIEGVGMEVGPEDCVVIEENKEHSQRNPFETDVTWIYFGVATD